MAVTAAQVKKIVKVVSGIIYAQEGDYGSVNRNDNNHGISIGKCQWNAYWGRALPLLQTIVKANKDQAKEILGDTLFKEVAESKASAWNKKVREATEEEAKRLSKLLETSEGKKAQDALADTDITSYIKNGIKTGVISQRALAYYADLENQGGSGASKNIATDAGNAIGSVERVGLDEIHTQALKNAEMGKYESRRTKVYKALKKSDLTDVESSEETGTGTSKDTTSKNTVKCLEKGRIVTFTGGGVYKSATASQEATIKKLISTCRITEVSEMGTHIYHLVSTDGKGVYGWVDANTIKEASVASQNDDIDVSVGDIVTFIGGGVYKSATASQEATTKEVISKCKVTAVMEKGTHPYHCISMDGKAVYGWVDKASVK